MATYIVADIQGCFDELHSLLRRVHFNKKSDQLWVAGDLVARGPKSLETLRFLKSLGDSAVCVLGNHDLHLLAVSLGVHPAKAKDKTQPILDADDSESLLEWLRTKPLLAEHPEFLMVHAGISPLWTRQLAIDCASEVEAILRGDHWCDLIRNMYANTPDSWSSNLAGLDKHIYTINALTRMRYCTLDARLDMACKLPPHKVNTDELIPWFKLPKRIPLDKKIIFGHWAALEGIKNDEVIGLDTGCVWGGTLTMMCWESQEFFSQPSLNQKKQH
jgi:bis(5'-nucleosyl)-tetraphosphatase (symmetrical)